MPNAMHYGLTEIELKTIVEYLSRHSEVEEAVLFGSRAIGSYKKASDIDIAIKGTQVTPFTAAALKSELEEETVIPYFFDIVSYRQLTHREFIRHIDSCGVSIYKRQQRNKDIQVEKWLKS